MAESSFWLSTSSRDGQIRRSRELDHAQSFALDKILSHFSVLLSQTRPVTSNRPEVNTGSSSVTLARSASVGFRLRCSIRSSLSQKTLSRASIVSLFDLSFRLVLLMEACGRLWYYGIERSQIRELNLNFHILRRTSRMLLSRACLKGQSRVSSTGWIRYSLCLRDETMIQSDAVFRTNFALWKKHFSRTDNDEGEGLAQIIERNVTQIRVGEKQARELSSIKRESK